MIGLVLKDTNAVIINILHTIEKEEDCMSMIRDMDVIHKPSWNS